MQWISYKMYQYTKKEWNDNKLDQVLILKKNSMLNYFAYLSIALRFIYILFLNFLLWFNTTLK